jgi:hypothetical protein
MDEAGLNGPTSAGKALLLVEILCMPNYIYNLRDDRDRQTVIRYSVQLLKVLIGYRITCKDDRLSPLVDTSCTSQTIE